MAITFAAAAYLSRSGAYLSMASDWTVALWLRQGTSTPGLTDFRTYWFWSANDDGSTPYISLGSPFNSNALLVEVYDGISYTDTTSITPVAATWTSAAIRYTASSHTLSFQFGGSTIGSITVNLGAISFGTPTELTMDQFSIGDLSAEYLRVWQARLTDAELVSEFAATSAVRTTNLLADTRIAGSNNVLDSSGNGRDWTTHGSLSYHDGPLPPANTTPATAIDVTSLLPYSVTLDVQDAPKGTGHANPNSTDENNEVWWTWTAGQTSRAMSFQIGNTDTSGSPVYFPDMQVWTGTPSALTLLSGTQAAWTGQTIYSQVGCTVGTTYYLQIIGDGSYPLEALNGSLVLALVNPDVAASVVGDVLIAPTNANTPAIVADQSDATFKREYGFPTAFHVSALSSGALLAATVDDVPHVVSFDVWADPLTPGPSVTSIIAASTRSVSPVSSNYADLFYACVSTSSAAATVYTITVHGVVGGTSWTLPDPSSRNIWGMAVDRADTILYWTEANTNTPVHAFDLGSGIALPDFVAAGVNTKYGSDLAVTAAGDVLIPVCVDFTLTPKTWVLRRYDSAGVLQQTYAIGTTTFANPARLALAADGSYWTNLEP